MFGPPIPICADCIHSYTLPDQPQYRRCDKSAMPQRANESLCGEMRRGECGPQGTMWEKRNG